MRALVILEHDGKAVRQGSYSAAAFAQAAVRSADGVELLLIGHNVGDAVRVASRIAPVVFADHGTLAVPVADRYAALIADVVRTRRADLVVAASTTFSRDIVGRAAGLLGGAMASEVVGH